MKVVILAGGLGTRISEESSVKPKPLIQVGGKPILWHIMNIYSHYGYNEFIICLGYKGNMIKEYFYNYRMEDNDVTFDYNNGFNMQIHNKSKKAPWKVTLVETGLNTMTGGRIKRIEEYIEDDTFMFTYGDGVSDVNIENLVNFHKASGKAITVTAVQPQGRFGVMKLNKNNVESFREKVTGSEEWINGGFFVASKEIFKYIKDDLTVLEQEPLMNLAAENKMSAYKHTGFWQPMDILKEKNYLEDLWNSGKAPWKLD